MKGEFWSYIIADVYNTLAHFDIRRSHNHSNSCLLCSLNLMDAEEMPRRQDRLYPALCSNDLETLESKKRCFQRIGPGGDAQKMTLEQYLHLHLGYSATTNPTDGNILTFVLILTPGAKLSDISNFRAKKNVIIVHKDLWPKTQRSSTVIGIVYDDFDLAMLALIHAFLLHKQRVRIKDLGNYKLHTYSSHFQPDECVFF